MSKQDERLGSEQGNFWCLRPEREGPLPAHVSMFPGSHSSLHFCSSVKYSKQSFPQKAAVRMKWKRPDALSKVLNDSCESWLKQEPRPGSGSSPEHESQQAEEPRYGQVHRGGHVGIQAAVHALSHGPAEGAQLLTQACF